MAYKVLYRKYRPMTFNDVIGQDQLTVTLKNELMVGRIAHAYLFTGSRGTGKTTCAKILAKAVNCLNPQNGDPCGQCESCIGLDNGSVMDVMEIDAASNNGVDSIRALIEETNFTPGSAKYRVYIIDEVHMLSDAAFNALLKTLEEPPAHVIFILATTEVHKLLPTILSRCQRFDFKRIAPEDIADRLQYVSENEGVTIDRDAALLIARIADGGMRDALSTLDQCIGRGQHIDMAVVGEVAGIAGRDHLYTLAGAVIDSDSVLAIETIAFLYSSSKDMSRLCEELASHFRSLMLIKTMGDKVGMIAVSQDELDTLRRQAVQMKLSTILHVLDTFQRTLDKMRFSNQRTELEMAFIRLCSPQLDTTGEAILRRLEALEEGRGAPIPKPAVPPKAAPTPVTTEVHRESPPNEEAPQEPKAVDAISSTATRFTQWPEVLHIIKQYSMTVGIAFASSSAYITGAYILVDGSEMAFDYLRKNAMHKDKLREAIFQVTGKHYNLGPYVGPKEEDTRAVLNPLDSLTQKARDAGIEVKIEE